MALKVDETEGRKGNPMRDEIAVAIDVGSRNHVVGVGLSDGRVLEEFEIGHDRAGFEEFFRRVERQRKRYGFPVVVAMEGTGGWARPLDGMIRRRGYELLNVNNMKLARFKEIFPAPAKSDRIDTRKMLELLRLRHVLPTRRNVLQQVVDVDEVNEKLKRLTRRRRQLVNEKTRVLGRFFTDLNAVCPGLDRITADLANRWFLGFVSSRNDLRQLARLRRSSLLKIPAIGVKRAALIEAWQRSATFADEAAWVGPMIVSDARRILELLDQIDTLDQQIAHIAPQSSLARHIDSIPGFGSVCSAELAGEIGTIERYRSEASLALYLGMAVLADSSGTTERARSTRHVNSRCKAAMMTASMRHLEKVPQSRAYYDKKRAEGKPHNHAVRCLGRHLVRVMWALIHEDRDYELR